MNYFVFRTLAILIIHGVRLVNGTSAGDLRMANLVELSPYCCDLGHPYVPRVRCSSVLMFLNR